MAYDEALADRHREILECESRTPGRARQLATTQIGRIVGPELVCLLERVTRIELAFSAWEVVLGWVGRSAWTWEFGGNDPLTSRFAQRKPVRP